MRILHVTPAFYPAHIYGGPIEILYHICRNLVKQNAEVRVLTTDANGLAQVLNVERETETDIEGFKVRYCRRLMRHSVSPALLHRMPTYIGWADVVHLTAAYSFPTIPTLFACRALGKRLVWAPQGALQRWEHSTRVKAKAVWHRICRTVAPQHLIVHASSDEEARAVRSHFPEIEVVVIPNGVDIPRHIAHVHRSDTLRVLYLGRLHPIKGLENLLAACDLLNNHAHLNWSLTIAGAGDPRYTETLLAIIIARRALASHVTMVGEVVDDHSKHTLFERADVVVVPSFTENFGMVVAEALAHGVPVIASTGTPWHRVEEIGCGLWVDNDPETLAKALGQISRMPLREMGQRGREWMQREFSWSDRAKDMIALYQSLVSR